MSPYSESPIGVTIYKYRLIPPIKHRSASRIKVQTGTTDQASTGITGSSTGRFHGCSIDRKIGSKEKSVERDHRKHRSVSRILTTTLSTHSEYIYYIADSEIAHQVQVCSTDLKHISVARIKHRIGIGIIRLQEQIKNTTKNRSVSRG